MTFSYEDYNAAVQFIQQQITLKPQIGLILGSGLGVLADSIPNPTIIPYRDIPHFPQSTVAGHAGQLVIGELEGKSVIVMQGRVHFYEGHSMAAIGFPVRVMQLLGVQTLIVTNASGGVRPGFQAGDLMIINDHINLLGMMGHNPLIGPNDERFGPRFPDFSNTYTRSLRTLAHEVAAAEGLSLKEGVYLCLSGPTYESPADIRMIRAWGADAVGMSTVPEVVVARHGGLEVFGLSIITNVAIDQIDQDLSTNHDDVLTVGQGVVPQVMRLLRGMLRRID